MNLQEYQTKLEALKKEGKELTAAGKLIEAEAKNAEIEALQNSFQAEKEKKAEENAMDEKKTVPGTIQQNEQFGVEAVETKVLDAASPEYRNAFLKHISGRDDEMTKLENEAFVHTTQNTPNVLPKVMLDQIWDLVSKEHVIVGDVTRYNFNTVVEIPKFTAITQGAATTVNENAANDDEHNTFAKVTLSGKDFSKSVEITYAMATMSIDALEQFLISEISRNLGEALADDMVSTIESGINGDNKFNAASSGTLAFGDITKAFGKLKRTGTVKVYLTRATLYNHVVGMTNSAGQLIYQPNANAGANGTLLGAEVKIEESVADGKILIGDPKRVVNNVFTDILVETDKDIKKHKYIYSGYERSECALMDDRSFAEITINF